MAFGPARTLLGALLLSATAAHAAEAPSPSTLLALSEIKREELPPPGGTVTVPDTGNPEVQIPSPEPIRPQTDPNASPLDDVGPKLPEDGAETPADNQTPDPARPNIDPDAQLPTIEYDLTKLPQAVRDTHAKVVAAAKSGSIENLRTLIGSGENTTQFTLGANEESDPLTFLKSLSGDEEGQEILAILLEILDAGYVHLDAGTPQELYVWPYFFAIPLEKLTPQQRVELFKIVTSGDVEDMKSFGTYIFYRAGISPDGKWRFFLAGE